MIVGAETVLPKLHITWPHQVRIGRECVLEHGIYFKFDGIWTTGPAIEIGDRCFIGAGCEFNIRKKITVGESSAIASGCKFIDHDHGITGTRIDEVPGIEARIEIGKHVWIGANVVVLKGVKIHDSAVVAACAVVTKSIPVGEIWGGVPARRLSSRSTTQVRASTFNEMV